MRKAQTIFRLRSKSASQRSCVRVCVVGSLSAGHQTPRSSHESRIHRRRRFRCASKPRADLQNARRRRTGSRPPFSAILRRLRFVSLAFAKCARDSRHIPGDSVDSGRCNCNRCTRCAMLHACVANVHVEMRHTTHHLTSIRIAAVCEHGINRYIRVTSKSALAHTHLHVSVSIAHACDNNGNTIPIPNPTPTARGQLSHCRTNYMHVHIEARAHVSRSCVRVCAAAAVARVLVFHSRPHPVPIGEREARHCCASVLRFMRADFVGALTSHRMCAHTLQQTASALVRFPFPARSLARPTSCPPFTRRSISIHRALLGMRVCVCVRVSKTTAVISIIICASAAPQLLQHPPRGCGGDTSMTTTTTTGFAFVNPSSVSTARAARSFSFPSLHPPHFRRCRVEKHAYYACSMRR